ncbi:MAG: hypothetical protein KR126chlam4_01067 [Candidatus Anoxychlamydiales bacterium]|nr:hypothetical protein [Candidatus Anoxychlamydiales bacterium]
MSVPATSREAIRGSDAEIAWNPEPVKSTLKAAFHPCIKAIVEASATSVKVATDQACSGIPGPVKDWATEASVQEVSKRANKALDQSVDSIYQTPDSCGSRIITYFK